VNARLDNQELPYSVVSVSPGRISYSEISMKTLEVQGVVVDALTNSKVSNSTIEVVGSSKQTQSTPQGFNLKIPSSDSVVMVEAKPEESYLKSRVMVSRSEAKNLQINVFKRDWVKEELKKVGYAVNPKDSILIGAGGSNGFRALLDDPVPSGLSSEKAEPQIFYFNKKGDLDSNLLDSVDGSGGFIMVNIKPGLHTLVIQNETGEDATTRLFAAEPGVVSFVAVH